MVTTCLGYKIPNVKSKDFSKLRMTRDEEIGIWDIIGPTVEMNINRCTLRALFITVYMQGLENGYNLAKETSNAKT